MLYSMNTCDITLLAVIRHDGNVVYALFSTKSDQNLEWLVARMSGKSYIWLHMSLSFQQAGYIIKIDLNGLAYKVGCTEITKRDCIVLGNTRSRSKIHLSKRHV